MKSISFSKLFIALTLCFVINCLEAVNNGKSLLIFEKSPFFVEAAQTCSQQGGDNFTMEETCPGSCLNSFEKERCCTKEFTEYSPLEIKLEYIKSLKLTDESEGYGARPEIVANGNYFYIIYLGDITTKRCFKLRCYDRHFNLIEEKILIPASPEYGNPTDIRISKDGDYVYIFYELSSKEKGAHLFAAKYKLDKNFTKVAESNGPIAESGFFFDLADGEEQLDDPASVVADGRVYLMTKIKGTSTGLVSAKTLYRLRELSPDLSEIIETRDIDLSELMDGWATVNSLFYGNGKVNHIQKSIRSFSPRINSDLKMIRFDEEWEFDESRNVFNLTNTNDDSEGMPTGVRFIDSLLFLSYRTGKITPISEDQPKSIGGPIWLSVYNNKFDLLDVIRVGAEEIIGEHSSVEIMGDYVFVVYGGESPSVMRENIYVDIFKFRDTPNTTTTAVSTTTPTTITNISSTTTTASETGFDFEASPIFGYAPFQVKFTLLCEDDIESIGSYLWDFGDGSTSTEQNPSHTYITKGNYTVRLTVIGTDDTSKTKVKSNHIIVQPSCPFVTSLENQEEIKILRNFRDHILKENVLGLILIYFYYRHSSEVTEILLQNPEIKARLKYTVSEYITMIDALNSGEEIFLREGEVTDIIDLLKDISVEAKPRLKTDITMVIKSINEGDLLEGSGFEVE